MFGLHKAIRDTIKDAFVNFHDKNLLKKNALVGNSKYQWTNHRCKRETLSKIYLPKVDCT